jgi:hypothetical protein
MNWLIRLGDWWERRRVVRKPEIVIAYETLKLQAERYNAKIKELENKWANMLREIKDSQTIPQTIAKEFALLNARMNAMELFVGLKREPGPVHVQGEARIK